MPSGQSVQSAQYGVRSLAIAGESGEGMVTVVVSLGSSLSMHNSSNQDTGSSIAGLPIASITACPPVSRLLVPRRSRVDTARLVHDERQVRYMDALHRHLVVGRR